MNPKMFVSAAVAALLVGGVALTAVAQTTQGMGQGMGPGMGQGMGQGMEAGEGAGPMFFTAADADGDGKVTKEEFQAYRAAQIEGLDADGDGLISKEELVAHYTQMTEAMISARVDRQMENADLDGDGKLSAAELVGGMQGGMGLRIFDRVDANGDGAVTQEEIAAMRTMGRDRFGERGERGGRFGGQRSEHGHGGDGDGMQQRRGEGRGDGNGMYRFGRHHD